jgi:membrane-bound metal-dependent hydrolase YbcI (DUF457 family)|nr:metal-dependent hydrolase [uncultured Methanoregula sp.]
MNHGAHVIIGILAFSGYNGLHCGILSSIGGSPAGLWLVGIFLAISGATIPDLLEPARHWTHRGFFHSRRMLSFTGWLFLATAGIGLFLPLSYYISSFLTGYISHLLADSTTKSGLPR